ncbi:transcriptional regulator [Larkinella sp. C7]|nr:transcriptional regulator [Larkinella sp. C7]
MTKDNFLQTLCEITDLGLTAFENYVNALEKYIKK